MPIEPFTYNGVERLSLEILENTPTPTGLLFGLVAYFFLSLHLIWSARGGGRAPGSFMECGDLSPLLTGRLDGPPQHMRANIEKREGGVTSPAVKSGDKSPHSIGSIVLKIGVFIAYLFFVVLTALTYSRGAWCALMVALLALLLALRVRVKHGVALVAVTALVFLCIPQGVSRAASFGEIRSDKAIANRLELWRGASHLIADNPLSGVGLKKIGIEYQKYWQPFGKGSRYLSAVNLPLTLYAGCGALVFALYAAITIVSLRFSYMLMRSGKEILPTWFFSAVICFTVANLFATIYDTIIIFPLLGLAPLIIYHAIARFRVRELFRHWAVMLAVFLVVMAIPFGVSRLSARPITVVKYPAQKYTPGIHAEHIIPASGDRYTQACVIVWCDASDRLSSARGIRLGRLACAAGLEALVIQGVNVDFSQPWTQHIVMEFARGRSIILCADGPVVFGMHEYLIPRMASPDKNLLGTICIYEESGRGVGSAGEERDFKPANITVFLDDPKSMEALLLKSYMEKRTRNVFLTKDFPAYEEDMLEWIRAAGNRKTQQQAL